MLKQFGLVSSLLCLLTTPSHSKVEETSLQGVCLRAIENITIFEREERERKFPEIYHFCQQLDTEERGDIPFHEDEDRQDIMAVVFANLRIHPGEIEIFEEGDSKDTTCYIWANYNKGEIQGPLTSSPGRENEKFYGPNSYRDAYLIQTKLEPYVYNITWGRVFIEIKCGNLDEGKF
jgi:hypothetical protein